MTTGNTNRPRRGSWSGPATEPTASVPERPRSVPPAETVDISQYSILESTTPPGSPSIGPRIRGDDIVDESEDESEDEEAAPPAPMYQMPGAWPADAPGTAWHHTQVSIDQLFKVADVAASYVNGFIGLKYQPLLDSGELAHMPLLFDRGKPLVSVARDGMRVVLHLLEAGWKARGYAGRHLGENAQFAANSLNAQSTSPQTKAYFGTRTTRQVLGTLASGVGIIGTAMSLVNIPSTLRHGVASAKAIDDIYMLRFSTLYGRAQACPVLRKSLGTVLSIKYLKAFSNVAKTGAAVVPPAALSLSIGGHPISSALATGVLNTAGHAASSSALWYRGAAKLAARELHWRAYLEQANSDPDLREQYPALATMACQECGDRSCIEGGLATDILRQLFSVNSERLSHYVSIGIHHKLQGLETYIAEPAGWMVILDVINLI